LLLANRIAGPALIEEYASTTVVHPGDVAAVDAFGNRHRYLAGGAWTPRSNWTDRLADPVLTEIVRNGLIARK
jgi:hypothetical protein